VTEGQSNLETKICDGCHEEKKIENFPMIEKYRPTKAQLKRVQNHSNGCKQCHENSKNAILPSLFKILSTDSQDLKEEIDYSSLPHVVIGRDFKVTIENKQFIETIQFIAKSIAHHYYYQINQGRFSDITEEEVVGRDMAYWKDEFLHTLEVYQRLIFVVSNQLRMGFELRSLIEQFTTNEYRRITPESEPSYTRPWISFDSLTIGFGLKDYEQCDMLVCSHCFNKLRKKFFKDYEWPWNAPASGERVRVFRQEGLFSRDFTSCDWCGGSCNYCDEETILYGSVIEGDWEGTVEICVECNEKDLAIADFEIDAQEEDFEQAPLNELLMSTSECTCGGLIDRINDMTVPERILRCENCELEYKFCSTCSDHYLASSGSCPNDHFFD